MARRACVAVGAFLGLTAIILVRLFFDGSNQQDQGSTRGVLVSHTSPQHNAEDRTDTKLNAKQNTLWENPNSRTASLEPCTPQDHIVFLKTHKTASSTTAGIIDLYAYKNNLSMAIPPNDMPYMHRTKLFQQDMIHDTTEQRKAWRKDVGFHILSSHARYNKPEMDAVVHNAKYLTILRHPSTQFVSAFVFFNFDDRFDRKYERQGRTYTNVVEEFMKNPKSNIELVVDHNLVHVLHNEQFFDLGLDTKYADDWDTIDATIEKLDREMDLVLIAEYYDESLILMRDLLCWTNEDILYTRKMVHNTSISIPVSPETRQKIQRWNAADTELYNHYNQTLWQRIADYGPSFEEELRRFRLRLENVTEEETGSHRKLMRKMRRRMQTMGILV